jgi:hypothetical protein
VAWFLGIMGMLATATFFGDPPSGDQMLGGIVMLAGAAAAIVGGPFTVWFLRRSIPWLVATVASGVAALGGLAFVFSATG